MKKFTLSSLNLPASQLVKLGLLVPAVALSVTGCETGENTASNNAADKIVSEVETIAKSTIEETTDSATQVLKQSQASINNQTQIQAGTITEKAPETAKNNPDLPLIHNSYKSDHIKANVLNPYPVCNASEDVRTVIYKVSDNWLPVGTISTYNQTNSTIPVTQTTSKSQTISISVNGSQSQSVTANLGGDASASKDGASVGNSYGIAFSLARQFGGQASYSLSWDIGQQIGPYDVPAGYTGDATYGFRSVNMSGTRQFCKANGTWSNPTAWRTFVPIKNEVRLKLYDNIADSANADRTAGSNFIAPTPKPAAGVNMNKPATTQAYDLEPYMTVSSWKAAGYAGSTALHVKNVGSENYYGEFPVISFLVEVKTASGPEGVDRVIKPSWFKGAYVQDLGFDRDSSTRSFLVTLSNPVNVGEDITLASFNFFDGLTKAGRIRNYIKISQVGRVEGDDTYYNDTLVDSRETTLTDSGRANAGLF